MNRWQIVRQNGGAADSLPLSSGEILARGSSWQADRQMDKQAPLHTDTKADRQEDWRNNKWRDWQEDRQACRAVDRELARQACITGSWAGGWQGKETWGQQVPLAGRESEVETEIEWKEEKDEVRAWLAGWLLICGTGLAEEAPWGVNSSTKPLLTSPAYIFIPISQGVMKRWILHINPNSKKMA